MVKIFNTSKHGTHCISLNEKGLWLYQSYKWRVNKDRGTFYLRRSKVIKGKNQKIQFHRQLLNLNDKKLVVDHINGNGLDNRFENLRICTPAENTRNQKIRPKGLSKYKGVTWDKNRRCWKACMTYLCKTVNLGRFKIEEDAARAYDKKAKELFSEFAQLNFKEEI